MDTATLVNESFDLGPPSLSKEGAVPSASSRIYHLQWDKYFPLELEPNLSVTLGTYSEAVQFMSKNFKEIYNLSSDGQFLAEEYSDAKRRYYAEMGDFFFFKEYDRIVGVFVGTPVDWSTYFFRNCSILPSHQGRKLYQKLLGHLLEVLKKYEIHRVEGEVSPSNLGHIHILNKLQFNISGLKLSERWGSLLQFTKYLSPLHESVFLDQFCHGIRPQVRKHV